MNKQRTMKWYREQLIFGLEKSRSKVLHEFLFSMMSVYFSDPERYEQSLKKLRDEGAKA